MNKKQKYTKEMIAWVKDNQKGISRAELTAMFNKRFNLSRNSNQVSALCRRHGLKSGVNGGQIKKGDKPWNLGKPHRTNSDYFFKKGHGGFNTRPVGSERTTKDGYIAVKVADPRTWRLKHIVVWESVNGKLPKGHCIRLLDNDRTNCDINNLICVSRGANATSNKHNKANTSSAELNKAILMTENLRDKLRSKTNEPKTKLVKKRCSEH